MADLLKKINLNGTEYELGMSSVERAKLDAIAENAQVNVLEGVQVDGVDLSISDKKVNVNLATPIADAVNAAKDGLIGKEGDASTADTVYGAKKYADEKAAAAQSNAVSLANEALETAKGSINESIRNVESGLDAKIGEIKSDYLTSADKTEINGAISALDGRVATNEGAIEVLNGEGDGSVKKQVAEAIANVVNNAPEDFDTLKEVADWIASDTTGAAKMQADIARLDGTDTVDGSVKKQIKDAVAAEAAIARAAEEANAGAIATEKGRIDGIVADYLKAADKAELQGGIDGLRTDLGNKGDAADSEGSAFARIAKVAADLSALQGEGGSVASQINAAITGYDTATVQPLAGKVSANETKLAGISEGANKVTMAVEGETLKITIA